MIAIAGLTFAVAACGDAHAARAGAAPEVATSAVAPSSSPSRIRVVTEQDADLFLWVSNQSFQDASVGLKVSIDDTAIVDQRFEVQGQHNWVLFPVTVPPGDHALNVVSDTGAQLKQAFTLPTQGRRYAVIDYWYYPPCSAVTAASGTAAACANPGEGRHITWQTASTPFVFS
jgi:hypothetical protein